MGEIGIGIGVEGNRILVYEEGVVIADIPRNLPEDEILIEVWDTFLPQYEDSLIAYGIRAFGCVRDYLVEAGIISPEAAQEFKLEEDEMWHPENLDTPEWGNMLDAIEEVFGAHTRKVQERLLTGKEA